MRENEFLDSCESNLDVIEQSLERYRQCLCVWVDSTECLFLLPAESHSVCPTVFVWMAFGGASYRTMPQQWVFIETTMLSIFCWACSVQACSDELAVSVSFPASRIKVVEGQQCRARRS